MDSTRFDALARSVVAPGTRRLALRLLAGGLLGALLPSRAVRARQRPDRDGDGLFDDDEVNVYGTDPDVYDTDGDGVGDGEEVYVGTNPRVNENASANCGAGLTNCGGICVDTVNDRLNCGACGAACAEFVNCWESNCGGIPAPPPAPLACSPGLHDCGGDYCVNISQDAANCGFCGKDCGSRDHYFCYLGMCVNYCDVGTRRCTGEIHCRSFNEPCPA